MECQSCRQPISPDDAFCPACGAAQSPQAKVKAPKTIQSEGNYSGQMIKGKGGSARKIFIRILVVIVLCAIGYLIYWIKTDPEAVDQIIGVIGGIVVMGVLFVVYSILKKLGLVSRSNDGYDYD